MTIKRLFIFNDQLLPQSTAFILVLFVTNLIAQSPADYVNPFIGTSNYGATNPGAIRPAGMASVVPFNVAFKKGEGNQFEKDSEWHSRPYVHENTFLTGFSHVNLSGVGCPDLGSILLMPTSGKLAFDPEVNGTTFSKQQAVPGHYACHLDKHNIEVAATATTRVGVSQFTFPAGQANILLNLGLGLTNETGAHLRVISDTEVEGYKIFGDFCYTPEAVRPVYFVVRVSKPTKDFGAWKKMPNYQGVEGEWSKYNDQYKPYPAYTNDLAGENLGAYFSYQSDGPQTIEVQVGISYTSVANARRNLEAEMAQKDFATIKKEAYEAWNERLSRIRVTDKDEKKKTLFYTALYHLLIHPSILQDVNGDYPAMRSSKILNAGKRNRYTVFSLWDTYRNVHPFLSLVYPDLQSDMLASMVGMFEESGWMPRWELMGLETHVMVGDPAAIVFADSYLRGIRDFDVEKAYEGARKNAIVKHGNFIRKDNYLYDSLGYIPQSFDDLYYGAVSASLEYNIADWNLGQLAKALGKEADYTYFNKRSKTYVNYFDAQTQMLRPRVAGGAFYDKFDPELGKNFEANVGFVEGNAWQYRFYVPHDTKGLIQLLGGEQNFLRALQACFDGDHYDAANEPDITYPYLFNFVKGEEWRTQKTVQSLVKKHYKNTPNGIPGNDDTGTLSCWLLYSMLGFYPHCPGDMNYALSTPMLEKVEIDLHPDYYAGKTLLIETKNAKEGQSLYMDIIKWKGKRHRSYFINHTDLIEGGVLQFRLKENH
ncbi:MAG: GH92 family glycosyl hydrolase [Bacteroidota bacterium]